MYILYRGELLRAQIFRSLQAFLSGGHHVQAAFHEMKPFATTTRPGLSAPEKHPLIMNWTKVGVDYKFRC